MFEGEAFSPQVRTAIATLTSQLKCRYVSPSHPAGALSPAEDRPRPSALSRFLFPLSHDAIGVEQPHAVVRLLLVANITPRRFWDEVEEIRTDRAYSLLKTKTLPSESILRQRDELDEFFTVLQVEVEVTSQIILLEYYQTFESFEDGDLIGANGRNMSWRERDHELLRKARDLQRICLSASNTRANHCYRLARNSGILSERLSLLSTEQVFTAATYPDDVPDTDLMRIMWDLLEEIRGKRIPGSNALAKPPRSAFDGFQKFCGDHSVFLMISVSCWVPGQIQTLSDAFFDVVELARVKIEEDGNFYGTRTWPYSLSNPADEGTAYYLIGLARCDYADDDIDDQAKNGLESRMTRIVEELAVNQLGRQFKFEKNAECWVSATATTRSYNIFKDPKNYLQRHVASVRGLRATGLPLPEENHRYPDAWKINTNFSPFSADTATGRSSVDQDFRTEKEAMDQLRWDRKYSVHTYEVGYVDRFTYALMWKPIEEWQAHQQALDFIPLHRVRQIRVVETGDVIWDRIARVDKLK